MRKKNIFMNLIFANGSSAVAEASWDIGEREDWGEGNIKGAEVSWHWGEGNTHRALCTHFLPFLPLPKGTSAEERSSSAQRLNVSVA